MECEKLFNKIDEIYEEYVNIWEDVCNIESPSEYKEGVDRVGEYFINLAKKHNWDVEVFKQEVAGNAICITLNPNIQNSAICVSGHIDTVHPVGFFGIPAVKRDNEKIYGPGVLDCKGGVVAAFLAMDALNKCDFNKRPVKLLIQTDEEKGSSLSKKETIEYICKKAQNSIAFLNCECHKPNNVTLVRKGILRYRFVVTGKAVHSASCKVGVNAIVEAAHKIIELEKMKDIDGLTCNCGIIQGGTAPNTVADSCMFTVDIRFSTEEELEFVRKKINEITKKSELEGANCKVEEIAYRPAMYETEKNVQLLEKANKIFEENGLPVLTGVKSSGGSDASYITQCGIPCIDSIGVEGQYAHSINEYAYLKSLSSSAKRIAAIIYSI